MTANSSSQTALDIAKFWGHRHISNLLSRTDDSSQWVLPGSDLSQHENYFSREMLDRLSAKRTDEVWLKARQRAPDTIYLMFSNLNPMICSSQDGDKVEVTHSSSLIFLRQTQKLAKSAPNLDLRTWFNLSDAGQISTLSMFYLKLFTGEYQAVPVQIRGGPRPA